MNNCGGKMNINQRFLFNSIILFFFCLSGANNQILKKPNYVCQTLLDVLSDRSSKFIQCAVKYSEPVLYCSHCVHKYTNATQAFYNLTITDDENGAQTSCGSHYIDNDRLNIVLNTQNYIKNLWTMGSCNDCYDCDLDKFPTACNKSAHTEEFQIAHSDFSDCTDKYTKDDICENCIDLYNLLNSNYSKIRKEKGDHFCFDIKDLMNKTRIYWSKELHCCDDRNPSKTVFYSLASTSACVVILFYLGVYVYGERQKRIGFVENDLNHRVRAAATIPNYNSITSSDPEPATSTNQTTYEENFISNRHDESEDEPLLGSSLSSKKNYLQ